MAIEFWCDSHGPIVQTASGKIRGYRMDGPYIFRGIRYAEAERSRCPTCPTLGGIRMFCLTYHQKARHPQRDIHGFRYWPEMRTVRSEYLDQDINNDVRRPVMVWIHGGGYTNGSAIEHKGYEADGLCTEGDVVVVSANTD